MSADPQAQEAPLWHAALRQSDDDAHRREDAWMREHAVEALEVRLAQANADRHAQRQAVRVRDALLAEQRGALAERDDVIASLHTRLEEANAALGQALATLAAAPLHRRALRRARRVAGRLVRRLAG